MAKPKNADADPEPVPDEGKVTRTLYTPDHDRRAKAAAQLGADMQQIADVLGVSRRTVFNWQSEHPSFAEAIKVGKKPADERVVRSLYERALGYSYVEEQAVKLRGAGGVETVQIVEVTRHVPPDTTAGIYWTKNRDGENWKDRTEKHHSGKVQVEHQDADEARATIKRFLEKDRPVAVTGETQH